MFSMLYSETQNTCKNSSISPDILLRFAQEYAQNNSSNDRNPCYFDWSKTKEEEEDSFEDGWFESESEEELESQALPWWYLNEEPVHLTKIFGFYTRHLQIDEERFLKDARHLSNFIGRIERIPVYDNGFTTLDKVDVFRRDIRPLGSTVSHMEEKYVLTKWDYENGLPLKMTTLQDDQREKWQGLAVKDYPVSYLYCQPVWQSKTKFEFSVKPEKHDIGYANEPFHYEPYIPRYLRCFSCQV